MRWSTRARPAHAIAGGQLVHCSHVHAPVNVAFWNDGVIQNVHSRDPLRISCTTRNSDADVHGSVRLMPNKFTVTVVAVCVIEQQQLPAAIGVFG